MKLFIVRDLNNNTVAYCNGPGKEIFPDYNFSKGKTNLSDKILRIVFVKENKMIIPVKTGMARTLHEMNFKSFILYKKGLKHITIW